MYYLDIMLIVNGLMDAFLLFFTSCILRKRIYAFRIFAAAVIGEIPVIFLFFEYPIIFGVSKIVVPFFLIGVGLKVKNIGDLIKGLLCFSLLAGMVGGTVYALAGWLGLTGKNGEVIITLKSVWFLPLIALFLAGCYRLWEKLQKSNMIFDNILYEVELDFEGGKILKVKALLDTGNELRDPFTDKPVMLLEEKAAYNYLPEKILEFLELPWRQSANPWPLLWRYDEYYIQKLVFISVKGINGEGWLPAIRLPRVVIRQGNSKWEKKVTVALIREVLSPDSKFQALLHPEHILKPSYKEEIA